MTATTPSATAELTASERALWGRFTAMLSTLPGALDERVRAATGLNHFQYLVLDALSRQPDRRLQLNQIARERDTSLSRLSHSITRLESAGLVERETCAHDRRANWAVLTDEGARVIDGAREAYDAIIRETLLDRVPPEHREGLMRLITELLPGDTAQQCDAVDASPAP